MYERKDIANSDIFNLIISGLVYQGRKFIIIYSDGYDMRDNVLTSEKYIDLKQNNNVDQFELTQSWLWKDFDYLLLETDEEYKQYMRANQPITVLQAGDIQRYIDKSIDKYIDIFKSTFSDTENQALRLLTCEIQCLKDNAPEIIKLKKFMVNKIAHLKKFNDNSIQGYIDAYVFKLLNRINRAVFVYINTQIYSIPIPLSNATLIHHFNLLKTLVRDNDIKDGKQLINTCLSPYRNSGDTRDEEFTVIKYMTVTCLYKANKDTIMNLGALFDHYKDFNIDTNSLILNPEYINIASYLVDVNTQLICTQITRITT